MSAEGQQKFNLENELAALEQVNNDKRTKALSADDIARMEEIREELKELKYSREDKIHLPNTNRAGYINGEVSKISYNQAIEGNNVSLNDLKDIGKIKAKLIKKNEEALKNAKSQKEIDRAAAEAKKAGVASKKFEADKAAKEAEIARKAKIQSMPANGPVITPPAETPPVQSSKPAEVDDEVMSLADLLKQGKLSNVQGLEDDSNQAYSPRKIDNSATPEQIEKAKQHEGILVRLPYDIHLQ